MCQNIVNGARPESLVDMLASKDGMIRQKARKALVDWGKPAVSPLTQALKHSRLNQVRWEAAKALGAISDTRAVPTLVKALEDTNPDVAWLAAEALMKFRKAAWLPLFQMLIKRGADSSVLRQGAHHVLWKQKEDGFNDVLATLTKALEPSGALESMRAAAQDILNRMKVKT